MGRPRTPPSASLPILKALRAECFNPVTALVHYRLPNATLNSISSKNTRIKLSTGKCLKLRHPSNTSTNNHIPRVPTTRSRAIIKPTFSQFTPVAVQSPNGARAILTFPKSGNNCDAREGNRRPGHSLRRSLETRASSLKTKNIARCQSFVPLTLPS